MCDPICDELGLLHVCKGAVSAAVTQLDGSGHNTWEQMHKQRKPMSIDPAAHCWNKKLTAALCLRQNSPPKYTNTLLLLLLLQVGMRPTAAQHDSGAACTLTPSSCVSRPGCPFGLLLGGSAAAAVVGAAVGAPVLLAAACRMHCWVGPACSRGAIAAAQCAVSTTAGDRTHR